jgi:non-canonical poly(A) RNA polymerase PAPD5/7
LTTSRGQYDDDLAIRYHNEDRISIIDPNNPANDITGGSSNTVEIKWAFSKAYKALHARMVDVQQQPELRGASILEVILGGNYSEFREHREHLRYIAEHGRPPTPPPKEKRHIQW